MNKDTVEKFLESNKTIFNIVHTEKNFGIFFESILQININYDDITNLKSTNDKVCIHIKDNQIWLYKQIPNKVNFKL